MRVFLRNSSILTPYYLIFKQRRLDDDIAIEITYTDENGEHVFVSKELTMPRRRRLGSHYQAQNPDGTQTTLIKDQLRGSGIRNQVPTLTDKRKDYKIKEFSCKHLD